MQPDRPFPGLVSTAVLLAVWAPAVPALDLEVGETRVSVGGSARFDAIHNFDADLGDRLFVVEVPLDDAGAEGATRFHARQSRLNFATRTPVREAELATRLEFDLFGRDAPVAGRPERGDGFDEVVGNSSALRIRHAYGAWNGILAGQTWSNFVLQNARVPTLDDGGPAALVYNRQPQMRYSVPFATGEFSLALENPEATLTGDTGSADGRFDRTEVVAEVDGAGAPQLDTRTVFAGVPENDTLPDLTLRFRADTGGLGYELAGVVNRLEWDDGGADETRIGWGTMAALAYQTGGGSAFGASGGYVKGANRYLNNAASGFLNGFVAADGDIETRGEWAALAFADLALSAEVRTLLAVGYTDLDSDAESARFGMDGDTTLTVHANVRFSPFAALMYGFEYQYARREVVGGEVGRAGRLQFTAQYSF